MPKPRSRGPVTLTPREVEGMRKAGALAARILDEVAGMVKPGVSTGAINDLVDRLTREAGATSGPYRYTGGGDTPFPKHCCTSVNEVVCHGIPSEKHVLREGDIINVDVTPVLDGYYGDTSRTYLVGKVSAEARRLVAATEGALKAGIQAVRPGATVGDIGAAIQAFIQPTGLSIVRQFAGHGIGRVFHGPPSIAHYGKAGTGDPLLPGMTFTIEPMINVGDWRCRMLDDGWTAITADRQLSAQFEHTLTVTESGYEIHTVGRERIGVP
ncbi:MAG: type I methionyl aminopeptidase [Planctomycetia bacterium]